MKANELMIGDWVHVEAHRGFNAQNVKVETIPDNDGDNKYGHHYGHICTWLDGGDNDFRDVETKHIQPIPLTTEILEKSGFNILRDAYGMSDPFWSYSNRSVLVDVTIIRTNNVKVIDWFNVKISTRNDIKQIFFFGVKYVHQLQHALRLCGIDKNIEL